MTAALSIEHAPRRRLAPNVVCLFQQDGPAIVNERRRGRFPRNVVAFRSRPRLMPGDMAEIGGAALPSNHGRRVQLLGRVWGADLPGRDWWEVQAVGEPLDVRDVGCVVPQGRCGKAIVQGASLRRVSNRQRPM